MKDRSIFRFVAAAAFCVFFTVAIFGCGNNKASTGGHESTPPDDDDNDDNDNDDNDDDNDASPDDDDDDDASPLPVPLKDDDGRTIILRGANFMAIEANGTPADYQRMAAWGFNIVRILITWQALEPTEGAYDENYLPNVVAPQVGYAYVAGLRPIVDLHQFHWSSCSAGMGIPDWTCVQLPQNDLDWLWQSGPFWDNADYLDRLTAAWAKVAGFFAGDGRVYAYDLFNEPIAGLKTLPWTCENQIFKPMYERLIQTVRAIDPRPLLIVEPSMVSTAGFPCVYDAFAENKLLYGPHIYPGTIAIGGGYTFPKSLLQHHFDMRTDEGDRLALPLLIGETGLASGSTNAGQYAHDFMDMLDAKMAHLTWWAFGYDDTSMGLDDSNFQPKELFYHWIARPYPRATAGTLRAFHFDTDATTFTLTFDTESGMAPAAEIWLNKPYWFPNGYSVTSSDPDGAWHSSFDDASGVLTVNADAATAVHNITISPSAE